MADTPYYIVNNTYKFAFSLIKDGIAWDLSTATVTVILISPIGTLIVRNPVLLAPLTSGQGYYITQTLNDLTIPGCWGLKCHVVDPANNIDNYTQIYEFLVNKS